MKTCLSLPFSLSLSLSIFLHPSLSPSFHKCMHTSDILECVCAHSVMSTLHDPMDCSSPGSSVGFFMQEYWSGLPFPAPGDLPHPGIKPESPTSSVSPALAGIFFTTEPPVKPLNIGPQISLSTYNTPEKFPFPQSKHIYRFIYLL